MEKGQSFQQIVLEHVTSACIYMYIVYLTPYLKINSKWIIEEVLEMDSGDDGLTM